MRRVGVESDVGGEVGRGCVYDVSERCIRAVISEGVGRGLLYYRHGT